MTIASFTAAQEAKVDSKEWMNTSAAAKRLNVSTRNILHWVQMGYFPGAFKINPFAKNSPFLIPVSAIEEFERKRRKGFIPDKEE